MSTEDKVAVAVLVAGFAAAIAIAIWEAAEMIVDAIKENTEATKRQTMAFLGWDDEPEEKADGGKGVKS